MIWRSPRAYIDEEKDNFSIGYREVSCLKLDARRSYNIKYNIVAYKKKRKNASSIILYTNKIYKNLNCYFDAKR